MQTTYDKIYKYANSDGIMDVTTSLNYFVKKNNEEVYRGKVIFSIWDQNTNIYARAYINKDSAKLLLHSILHQRFESIYKDGFFEIGGTAGKNSITARMLEIHLLPNEEYAIIISEGSGIVDETIGSIQMNGEPDKVIQLKIPMIEMMKLSLEVYDYIRDQEQVFMARGKSLHTKTTYYQAEEKEEKEKEIPEYKIPYGALKGKTMNELTNQQLEFILKQKAKDTLAREMLEHARIEKDHRKI